jgi:hypothetical protein
MSMGEAQIRRCLRFSAGYLDLIRTGGKKVTFRAGRRKFRPGEIVEGKCAEGVVVPLRITGCETKPLKEVSEEEARADLFESRETVLAGMRRFYPQMTWETEISVIRFEVALDDKEPEGIAGPVSGA